MAARVPGPGRSAGTADAWHSHYRRAQADAATWLGMPRVLDLVREARVRAGAPHLDIEIAMPAIAAGLGIELLLDDEAGIADAKLGHEPADKAASTWLNDADRVAQQRTDLAVLASLIDAILPKDAPFEAAASTLTLAELVLGHSDLDRPAAEIAADLVFPPSPVRFDHRGGIEASWFASDRDLRFGRRLQRALRGTQPARLYNGGRRRAANNRAARARVGARALLAAYPTMTAREFEAHWDRSTDRVPGDRIWTAFAGPASWTKDDGRYTTAGFAAILREVRRTG